jgi:catechol 2,3-dioxygenase-like lactoylglutathione lyase family enzyme
MTVLGIDHVQLAMPFGREDDARGFYGRVLGLREVPKPAHLLHRGGVWFEAGALNLHLGVEQEFRPARKAHPALLVAELDALVAQLRAAGISVAEDDPLDGRRRVYVHDPFGNRLELIEPSA